MNDEVRVCTVGELPPGRALRVDINGQPVCLVNLDGDLRAIGDTCSHGRFSLSEGEVNVEDHEIECPKHGSMFSLDTGWPQTFPATKPVPVFRVRLSGDDVFVAVDGNVQGKPT